MSITANVLGKLTDPRQEYDLGIAPVVRNILAALSSNIEQKCADAVEIVSDMEEQHFRSCFLGPMKTETLKSLACCVSNLPREGRHCNLLLRIVLIVEPDETDLTTSGLRRQLEPLRRYAPVATAALVEQILAGQQNDEAARCSSINSPMLLTCSMCPCIAVVMLRAACPWCHHPLTQPSATLLTL